jgi:predicted Ser/Thr protein kinase
LNPEIERLLDAAARLRPEQRADFLAGACPDPAMRAEVESLLQYANEAESYFDQAIQGVASSLRNGREPGPGDAVGSYRIVSLIGRGGMGNVYLAERADGEIEQKVAVKLLRADSHRPGWRERFLRERQLLATLHHPSVVHVIDAGHTADGRPFLAMEYVEGIPIDRFAASIEIVERLKLFLRVCDGVSHAHRHAIIHRDLKPSNILVDAAGQPKLLDFGIAKLLDETQDVTQTGERWLTPEYASPEQMTGDAQSTPTDIYSLGAVLYKLLTGVAPREGQPGTARKDITPPGRLNPEVPRDLDFVVAKAMRPEPEHRYASVDECANDVRAALEWRPVQARGGDFWYRTRRNMRRGWMPLAALLLLMSGLAAGLLVANRERAVAERRFADVRQLANKLFDIDAQVSQLPGGSKTRQLIVDTALEYLKRVTAGVRVEPDLALELGTAYMRVARVQGVNISPNLGQTGQADKAAQKAQALVDSVLAAEPGNRTAALRAGQIAHDRMILASNMHHNGEALRFAAMSVERLENYLWAGQVDAKSDRNEAQQVILAFINVANQYMLSGQPEQSLRIARRAIEIANATDSPTQAGAALMVVAFADRARGDLDGALRAIRESVRLLEPPDGERSTGRLQAYGLALMREGQILGEPRSISLNRPEEAAKCIEKALKIGQEFAGYDSHDFQSQYRVFLAETKLADIVRRSDPARALQMYDDGLRRLSSVSANAGSLRNETMTLAASTYPLLRLGRHAEAGKRLNAAFDRLARLRQYPAQQIEPGSPADETLRAAAEYEAAGGNSARAAARYEELLQLMFAANLNAETSLEDAVALSALYAAAAKQYRASGQPALASGMLFRRLKLWQHWETSLPGNAFVRRQIEASLAQQTKP